MKVANLLALTCLVGAVVCSCSTDPVQTDAIKALGREVGQANEFHRAGQPCTLCHQPSGIADSDFSVAGTIFAGTDSLVGVDGAQVHLVDADGRSPPVTKPIVTNCVGNFFVKRSDWDPKFPIAVAVQKGAVRRTMRSAIGQAGSCATCHLAEVPLQGNHAFEAVPHVYLFGGEDPAGKAQVCDRDPDLAGVFQ